MVGIHTYIRMGVDDVAVGVCGGKVMWVARVEHVESNRPVRVLRWATVEGLRSRGEVTFKENTSNGTTVELSVRSSLFFLNSNNPKVASH